LAVTLLSARAGIRKPGADGETLAVTEYAVCDIGERRRSPAGVSLSSMRQPTLSILMAPLLILKIVSLGRERQAGSTPQPSRRRPE
jgi:hypothetical protein